MLPWSMVIKDANKNEAHKLIFTQIKLEKVKVRYNITESRSQRSYFAFDPKFLHIDFTSTFQLIVIKIKIKWI